MREIFLIKDIKTDFYWTGDYWSGWSHAFEYNTRNGAKHIVINEILTNSGNPYCEIIPVWKK